MDCLLKNDEGFFSHCLSLREVSVILKPKGSSVKSSLNENCALLKVALTVILLKNKGHLFHAVNFNSPKKTKNRSEVGKIDMAPTLTLQLLIIKLPFKNKWNFLFPKISYFYIPILLTLPDYLNPMY